MLDWFAPYTYVAREVGTPFSISRSVRQGCPLAHFLYLLMRKRFMCILVIMLQEFKFANYGDQILSKCLIMNLLMTQHYTWMGKTKICIMFKCVVQEFYELLGAIINWNKCIKI